MDKNTISITKKQDKAFAILFFLLLVGVVCGATLDFKWEIKSIDLQYKSIYNSFFSFFLTNSLMICSEFLLGFSAVLQIFITFVPFLKGIEIGNLSQEIYLQGGFFNLVIFIPYAILTAIIIVLSAKEAFLFSKNLFTYTFFGKQSSLSINGTKNYVVNFLILELLTACVSLLHLILAMAFKR